MVLLAVPGNWIANAGLKQRQHAFQPAASALATEEGSTNLAHAILVLTMTVKQ